MERLLSRWHGNLIGPGVDNGFATEVVEVRDDPLLEFSFRSHPDATQEGARHFREEALDQVEPGAMLWREHEAEAALALCGKPLVGLLRHVRRMMSRMTLIAVPVGEAASIFLRKPTNSRERWRSSTVA